MTGNGSPGRVTRRQFLTAAGYVGAGLLAAACAPQAPAGGEASTSAAPGSGSTAPPLPTSSQAMATSGAPTGAVSISLGTDLRVLDPHGDTATSATNVYRLIYETLVERDDNMQVAPLLATSWKQLDSTTWEFKLREGVTFHDGQPFGANDVRFSFERMLDKDSRVLNNMATIDHVDVVDDLTVRIVTKKVDPILLARLTFPAACMLPEESFKKVGSEKFFASPAGTGPFKFVQWVKDDRLATEAAPNYWGTKPRIGQVTNRPIVEASTRVAALRTGEVDLIANVQPQQIPEIEGDSKLTIGSGRNSRVIFVGMNAFRKPFDDVRVRQAMNYAVDVDTIIKDLMGGLASRIPTIVGPDFFGYDPDQKPYPYEPDKAKQLLSEAGYPNGFEVTFNTPKGRYLLDAEVAQATAGFLSKVGVTAKVEITEWGNYIPKLFDANNPDNRYTMFLMGFGSPIMDIDDLLGGYLDSKRRGLYYNDPELDAMIAKGQTTEDPEQRKAIYKELLAHVREMAPWIFLFNPQDIYGVNKRLQGFTPRPDEAVNLSRAFVS